MVVARQLICFGLIVLFLAMLPGCGGCRQDPAKEKTQEEIEKELMERRRKEAEKPKADFEAKGVSTRPPAAQVVGTNYKPGHWTGAVLENALANNFDFVGEMELQVTEKGEPVPLLASPFELAFCRDMALAKGQPKGLESLLYVPPVTSNCSVACRWNASRGGRRAFEMGHALSGHMPSYQYHLVVMARLPELYGYVQRLDSVKSSGGIDNPKTVYYLVALPAPGRRLALPAHALQWTSIACVLWDDADPGSLNPDQQQAMLDWLHWGGQLILSGPDTLDTLRDSFLAPYLPAVAVGTCELGKADFAELNALSANSSRPLLPDRPWSGVRFQVQPGAEFVPGVGKLLVERRVGRGRIVVSAFRLSQREFIDWLGDGRGATSFLTPACCAGRRGDMPLGRKPSCRLNGPTAPRGSTPGA